MLSLSSILRFSSSSTLFLSANSFATSFFCVQHEKPIEEPALLRLKAERDPEKLFILFQANARNKLVIENHIAFVDTISRLTGARRFDYIERLLEYQKTLPQGRREGFIVRIIMLYGRAGMTKHAIDTFYQMHSYKCKRTVKSFNAALKVLAATRDLEAIESFIVDSSGKFDIIFDIFSLNIVVKAYCEMNILDGAYLNMILMEKLGIKPDVITYTTLISASYKNYQSKIGDGLWNLMLHKGCFPVAATFNVRIQYLINMRRACEANDLMRLMQKIGITPDEVTYNLVIKGFFLAGFLHMAKRVYFSLPVNGYMPNVKIYQTMIHYLCKGKEFDLAFAMSKECMKKNWFFSVETISTLLTGLKMNGELGKAKVIMSLVYRKYPPLCSKQLIYLRSILIRS